MYKINDFIHNLISIFVSCHDELIRCAFSGFVLRQRFQNKRDKQFLSSNEFGPCAVEEHLNF